jgi:hypothetical protein
MPGELLRSAASISARRVAAAGLACLLCSQCRSAAQAAGSLADDQASGAVVAPATLPEGAASAYAYGGVQEVGVGYRQGVSSVELEARAKLNYFLLSFAFEALLKRSIVSEGSLAVAPFLGVGIVHDTGSRYLTAPNFQYTGIRALGGAIGTYRLTEVATLVAELDIPLDLSLNPTQGVRFGPLAGGGIEAYLGSDISVLVMGQLGFTFFREPLGVPQWSLGYQLRAGFGFRLF